MIQYLKTDPWSIIEEGFDPSHHRSSESIFSIGNGRFGQRANFEEKYSGESLRGSYVAGVYYPDKTRVGWWKNGYPEYFAKVLNSTNWIGTDIAVDGQELDLAQVAVSDFRRELDMKQGLLLRSFIATFQGDKKVHFSFTRFCSMADDELAAIRIQAEAINFSGEISFTPYLEGDVKNHDANYDEKFWESISQEIKESEGYIINRTRKTAFDVAAGMTSACAQNGEWKTVMGASSVAANTMAPLLKGETIVFEKLICIVSSLNYEKDQLLSACKRGVERALRAGFDNLQKDHVAKWISIWDLADIKIEGDADAQQGIRFNIFHLNQTYTGEDARLNIGPKGFTGEKYGGSTYWDTEAYCIPFYMATKNQQVARQLLVYRYNQLSKAIENAARLGFTKGAALYPMVTMNGEECHNEWEITFEEIHRNGAIAYAIFNYIRYTGDNEYLAEFGVDVLLGIARFWAQRIHWSAEKNKYVMLGVTGPNEYENNVNNNWYTNYIATWCLQYASESMQWLKDHRPNVFTEKAAKLSYSDTEADGWKKIWTNMHFPKLEGTNVFLQQDGFMDKEQRNAADLDPSERPINQHWSWDRILRSNFIKQADVLQGIYFFDDHFDAKTIKDNFDFYEPKTVHESSLSPCVHSILAAQLGYEEKAVEMYMRTSRLDLDDYNHEAHEGLHITSMAGTWLAIVQGFGGMRVKDGEISFSPMLPSRWKGYSFNIIFRNKLYEVRVNGDKVDVGMREYATA